MSPCLDDSNCSQTPNISSFMYWMFIKCTYVCLFVHRAAGVLIGEGVSSFVTDWDKVSATVSESKSVTPVISVFVWLFCDPHYSDFFLSPAGLGGLETYLYPWCKRRL